MSSRFTSGASMSPASSGRPTSCGRFGERTGYRRSRARVDLPTTARGGGAPSPDPSPPGGPALFLQAATLVSLGEAARRLGEAPGVHLGRELPQPAIALGETVA